MKRYPTSLTIREMKTEYLMRSSHTHQKATLIKTHNQMMGGYHSLLRRGTEVKVSTKALENNFVIFRQTGDKHLPNSVLCIYPRLIFT